ncbi:MAG: type IV secretion system protein [Burkholderiales bacterium]
MKRTIIATLLAAMSFSSGMAAADGGIPVFDATSYMQWLQALQNDATEISTLRGQLSAMQQEIKNTTGTRGMGQLGTMGAAQSLMASWGSILQQVQSSTGTYGQLVSQIKANNAILTPGQISSMSPQQQQLLERTRNLGALQQSMALTTMNTASQQIQEIQNLTSQIDQAHDPKAIADLNAALNSKKLVLQNTQMQITGMTQQVQSEQRLIDQQAREMAISRAGSSSTMQVGVAP